MLSEKASFTNILSLTPNLINGQLEIIGWTLVMVSVLELGGEVEWIGSLGGSEVEFLGA